MKGKNTVSMNGGEGGYNNQNLWSSMANERSEKPETNNADRDIDAFSFYETNNIPTNPEGDPILDQDASYLPKDSAILANRIITTNEDIEYLMRAEVISLDNGHRVNSELLKRSLTSDAYYLCAKQQMLKENPLGTILGAYRLDYRDIDEVRQNRAKIGRGVVIECKSDLVRGLAALEEGGWLNALSDVEKGRLNEFKNITSFDAFAKKIHGTQFEAIVDNKQCILLAESILTFLKLSPEDFLRFCNTDTNANVVNNHLTKTEFAYLATEYLKKHRVKENYVFPEYLEGRMENLMEGDLIDFYAVNQLTETRDTLYEKVKINPELRKAILGQMPEEASRLEKATYIYIKMCMTLTYDNEYMVVGQTGKVAEKHKNLDYVEKISPENNEVTCSEFNIIYAKFLHELDLNFESEYKNTKGEQYGNAHASIRFRDGKFIVRADSTTRMIGGDMTNVKLWLPLVGFQCENKNKQTRDEFEESVSRMYNLVRQQEQEKMPWRKYNSLTKDGKLVGFSRKRSVFLDLLNDTQLRGVDLLAYVDQLKNVLFDEAELMENVSVIVLRNNKATDRDSGTEAGAVIALSPMNLYMRPDTTNYYYLSSNGVTTPLTLDQIQEKIDSGVFEYKKGKNARVPGTISKE